MKSRYKFKTAPSIPTWALLLLRTIGATYSFCSSMYFILLVPTYLGWDTLATYTYPSAQVLFNVAMWLAPAAAIVTCLTLLVIAIIVSAWFFSSLITWVEGRE